MKTTDASKTHTDRFPWEILSLKLSIASNQYMKIQLLFYHETNHLNYASKYHQHIFSNHQWVAMLLL